MFLNQVKSDKQSSSEYYHKKFRRTHSLINFEREFKQEIKAEERVASEIIIVKSEVSVDINNNDVSSDAKTDSNAEEKSFKCDSCPRAYASKKNLIRHQRIVHPVIKEHPCETCGKIFNFKRNLRAHLWKAHAKRHRCDACDKTFPSERDFDRHRDLVHRGKSAIRHKRVKHPAVEKDKSQDKRDEKLAQKINHPDKSRAKVEHDKIRGGIKKDQVEAENRCDECGKGFCNKSNLIRHINIGHLGNVKEKKRKCDHCNKMFRDKDQLEKHVKVHKIPKHKCDHCNQMFQDKNQLEKHVQVHKSQKHKCDHCNKMFQDKDQLEKHVKVHKIPKHKYDHCNQMFQDKSQLEKHVKEHESQKHKCDHCDKSFVWSHHLRRHLLKVHQDAMKKCEFCEKIYEFRSGRNNHECDGPKCVKCDMKFASRYTLLRHMRVVHQTEHKCSDCGKTFIKKISLNQHRREVHKS
ncbi:zinc finger protein 43-like isoform X1 [Trichogramma pretiosum]|uniref:zinc finger protein 43-like isoform X1 n=1 Tax=Trichogramma pretiosum TaxID=7493 RepID=UPI0006C98887|nr:zinc finger protein 43-like isoform X1 [Trichogramma pretiosum]